MEEHGAYSKYDWFRGGKVDWGELKK